MNEMDPDARTLGYDVRPTDNGPRSRALTVTKRDRSAGFAADLGTLVVRNPFMSLAIAYGAGVILGKALRG